MMAPATVVYLLHFDTPYPAGRRPRHYLGSTSDLAHRLTEHRRGEKSRLMAAVVGVGIGFCVTRTWPGGRETERQLKRRRAPSRLCPLCTGVSA